MTPHQEQLAAILAEYMAVRHLSVADAARALGRAQNTVIQYRWQHPETDARVTLRPLAKPAREGVVQVIIPMADPCRSSSVSAVPVMRVSLPAPPWGGGFERQGVKA